MEATCPKCRELLIQGSIECASCGSNAAAVLLDSAQLRRFRPGVKFPWRTPEGVPVSVWFVAVLCPPLGALMALAYWVTGGREKATCVWEGTHLTCRVLAELVLIGAVLICLALCAATIEAKIAHPKVYFRIQETREPGRH